MSFSHSTGCHRVDGQAITFTFRRSNSGLGSDGSEFRRADGVKSFGWRTALPMSRRANRESNVSWVVGAVKFGEGIANSDTHGCSFDKG